MPTTPLLRSIVLVAALLLSSAPFDAIASGSPGDGDKTSVTYSSLARAAEDVVPRLQTGSLLLSEGDCLAIRVYTASPYTHVAIVCIEDEQPIVYDSMNGVGVRRLKLPEYFAAESPNEVRVLHPRVPLNEEQSLELREYLVSQLGRPYAIHHHITGKRTEGVHCAEYATDALMSIGLIRAEQPSRVSPASLAKGITRTDIYTAAETVNLDPLDAPSEEADNRCHQLWIDTKVCTRKCCDKLSGWLLCR